MKTQYYARLNGTFRSLHLSSAQHRFFPPPALPSSNLWSHVIEQRTLQHLQQQQQHRKKLRRLRNRGGLLLAQYFPLPLPARSSVRRLEKESRHCMISPSQFLYQLQPDSRNLGLCHSLSIYYSYPTSAAYEMEGEREGDFLFPLFPECQNKPHSTTVPVPFELLCGPAEGEPVEGFF